MGVKPYLAASSIQQVVTTASAVLCPTCKRVADSTDPKLLKLIGVTPEEADGKIMEAVGCPKCNGLGYKGRQAIFEFMTMTNDIREMAFARALL